MEELQITPETARFIAAHRTEDVRDLALRAKRTPDLDLSFALDQIAGWQTARRKLPQWGACDGIVYPPHLSMEQCSSQFTAQYKADLARRLVAQQPVALQSDTSQSSAQSDDAVASSPTPADAAMLSGAVAASAASAISTTSTTSIPLSASPSQRVATRCDSKVQDDTGEPLPPVDVVRTSSQVRHQVRHLSQRVATRCDREVVRDGGVSCRRDDDGCVVDDRAAGGCAAADHAAAVAARTAPFPGTMVDLTGGFGVDFSTMARAFAHAVYVERQPHLCALASHNFRALGLKHAQVVNETAEQWLAAAEQWLAAAERQAVAAAQQTAVTADSSAALAMAVAATAEQPIMPTADSSDSSAAFAELSPAAAPAVGRSSTASTPAAVSAGSPGAPSSSEPSPAASAPAASLTLIYLDPARRDAHGGRTYAIHDCTPDVLALKDRLLTLTPHVIVKLSPMLDWRKAVDDFRGAVREVHIVSVANECKELLLVLGRSGGETSDDGSRPVRVCCVNDDDRLAFDIIDGEFVAAGGADGGAPAGASGSVVPPDAARYLYEPNASIMKAGCFRLVEERYGVSQIGPNSHLMMAAEPVPDFPGRGFTVDAICGMGKKELKRALAGVKAANIAVRNFPLTAVQLRGKLKLRDGGDVYLFGTTDAAGRHVIVRAHK